MITFSLHENFVFHDNNAYAEPLFVDQTDRILRFMLKPGQSVVEHAAPHSPVHIVVLSGTGLFSGGDAQARRCGPGTLLVFEPGESHAVHADEEALIFVAFLHGAPAAQTA
jgi:quercetin dioxygenase-like cupin family protein